MKKIIGILLLITTIVYAQDASRILTGSAQPPLPFNIITQPGFENRTLGWSVTGGTFTTTSTAANLARGRYSAQWTLPVSAASGTLLQSDSVTIPAGLYGRDCRGMLLYKGAAAANGTLTLEAYDGTNILGTLALPDSTYYTQKQTTTFTCPTSGSIRLRVRNTVTGSATPTVLYFDEAVIADANSVGIAGAITNVGTFGTVPDDKAASSSGTTLTIQPADATHPGAITAGTQTIGGDKTLAGATTLSALSTGIVHSGSGGALTSSEVVSADIAADTILNSNISPSAAIVDTKLATISTSGKVANSATTATSFNTTSAIVARNGVTGGFSAGPSAFTSIEATDITAVNNFFGPLTGNVTGNITGSSGSTTGNAATATALAANPTDCTGANYATSIDANGNLTCSTPAGTSLLTTKGDLYTYSSAVARLPVGTNNFVLMADSAESTGLKWGAPASSGSGMVIGQPVTGSTINSLLYADGSGNLAGVTDFQAAPGIFQLTGSTSIYQNGAAISDHALTVDKSSTNTAGSGRAIDAFGRQTFTSSSAFGANGIDAESLISVQANVTGSSIAGSFLGRSSNAGFTLTNVTGVQAATSTNGAGTVTNMYGVDIITPVSTGGATITNFHGLHIANPGVVATNNYSLYVAGGSSYFGGNVNVVGEFGSPLITSDTIIGNRHFSQDYVDDSTTTGANAELSVTYSDTHLTNASLTGIRTLDYSIYSYYSVHTLTNLTGGNLTIKNLTAGTYAQIRTNLGRDIVVPDKQSVKLKYNADDLVWDVVQMPVTLMGTTTNDSAAAGIVGEYVSASATPTAFPATDTYGDLGSITLTAGDWDISYSVVFTKGSGTTTQLRFGIGDASGNDSSGLVSGLNAVTSIETGFPTSTTQMPPMIFVQRASIASTTTYYGKVRAGYTGGAPTYSGIIYARRVR